jgi:diacylglycerol kinase family enzyme
VASGPRVARLALAALRDGEAAAVDLGLAGGRPFVNTSSTGVYVDLVNARRQLEPFLGKRLAEVVALISALLHGRPHELVLDSRRRSGRATTVHLGDAEPRPTL